MTSPIRLAAQPQAKPLTDEATGLLECNWGSSYTLSVPSGWVSGVYLAKLTASDSGLQNYIFFVVTDPASHSDLLYNIPVFTYAAYNNWGGKSLYGYNSTDGAAAVKVSLNRPFSYSQGSGDLLSTDIDSIRFLEKHGYDVSYSTDVDLHLGNVDLTHHKGFIEMGHPEYWSRPMRNAVSAARDGGIHLGFFSANEIYWQVRLESSTLTGKSNATVVCYRSAQLDPEALDAATADLTTVQWRNPPVNEPEASLLGEQYIGMLKEPVDLVVSNASSWVFAGTGLTDGSHLPNLVAGEVNGRSDMGPAGVVPLAQSPFVVPGTGGPTTHVAEMTVYTASSGAIVFDAGTLRWGWGLEPATASHTFNSTETDAAVQQITRNVLVRFGANPQD